MKQASDNPVRIGLAGLGTVGSGLTSLLRQNADWIRRRLGRDILVHRILVSNPDKPRPCAFGAPLTTDPAELTDDPAVDIVVELMGGLDAAERLITKALEAGKHVVTANKALLAERGAGLFALAAQKGLGLYYEASAAGAVPVVESLKVSLAGDRIHGLLGILNGTANYILTNMDEHGLDFDDVLKTAQEKGYAEADPTLDIEGIDAAHKLVLLIRLAFGRNYPFRLLPVEGITNVTPLDIRFAREFGCRIKLIGHVRDIDGRLDAGMHPRLVSDEYLLSQVRGAFNAVRIEGEAAGPVLLYGRGAGGPPTGGAVLSDIMALARRGACPDNTGFSEEVLPEADILDPRETVCRHYLRFNVKDTPGVMASISKVMAEERVSIRQAVQKGEAESGFVHIVFLTHKAPQRAMDNLLAKLDGADFLKPPIVHFRVL